MENLSYYTALENTRFWFANYGIQEVSYFCITDSCYEQQAHFDIAKEIETF